MNTPEPTILSEYTERFPSTEVDPNHEQLGQADLVVAAATSVSTKEPRAGNPPLELSELGQAQASTVRLTNMMQAREPEPGPLSGAPETSLDRKFKELQAMMTAAQTTLGDRSTSTQTTLEDRLTAIENNIAETREAFKTFKTTFGHWARPIALPVPYPNGELPDEAVLIEILIVAQTMARLGSRSSILNLDNKTLAEICTMYGIKYPKRVAQRDPGKMKQDLLDYICGFPDRVQADEEEVEDDEEEADNRE
ncbi:hypothetical protein FRC00_004845 [Tulasnella sp. 408]|nr:hypothetical protein FRC00_004845 [Tulasnella sp. 408]